MPSRLSKQGVLDMLHYPPFSRDMYVAPVLLGYPYQTLNVLEVMLGLILAKAIIFGATSSFRVPS